MTVNDLKIGDLIGILKNPIYGIIRSVEKIQKSKDGIPDVWYLEVFWLDSFRSTNYLLDGNEEIQYRIILSC